MKRFFADLKRRQVFKIAAMYGAVGFVVVRRRTSSFPLSDCLRY